MDKVCFRRLRWNSKWMILGVPGTIVGIWFMVHQLWNGFNALSTLMGLFWLIVAGSIVLYCLETVSITEQEVMLKLGPIVLLRMPVSEVRTITSAAINIGRGGSCYENLIFLSPKRLDEMIFTPSEHPRESLYAYYESKMTTHFLHPREGIWLQYTGDEIAKLFPNAENFIMKPDRGGARHG